MESLRLICVNYVVENEVVTFRILEQQYQIDKSFVARALNLLADNLLSLPSDQDLTSFFQNINYQG